MQVLIAISGFCGFCSRIGNAPCTTPFDFLFVISIHVPAWGMTMVTVPVVLLSLFQSTFPRGERRPGVGSWSELWPISIHVPAWGTTDSVYTLFSSRLFQSTFPHGERPGSFPGMHLCSRISIHVPAWGTTRFWL